MNAMGPDQPHEPHESEAIILKWLEFTILELSGVVRLIAGDITHTRRGGVKIFVRILVLVGVVTTLFIIIRRGIKCLASELGHGFQGGPCSRCPGGLAGPFEGGETATFEMTAQRRYLLRRKTDP